MDRYFILNILSYFSGWQFGVYIERSYGHEESQMYTPLRTENIPPVPPPPPPPPVPPPPVPPPLPPPHPTIPFWDESSYPIRTKCYPDTAGGELEERCEFVKRMIKETIRDKPRFLAPHRDDLRPEEASFQVESRLGAFQEFLRNVLPKQGWGGVDLDPFKQDIALWVQQYDTARRECMKMFDSV